MWPLECISEWRPLCHLYEQTKQVCCQVVRRNPWGRPDLAGEQSHFPKKSQRRRGWGYNQTRGRKAWPEKTMALDKSSGQMTVFERQGSRKWRSEWDWYSVRPWADDDGVRQVDCWGRAGVITWQTTHQAELAEGGGVVVVGADCDATTDSREARWPLSRQRFDHRGRNETLILIGKVGSQDCTYCHTVENAEHDLMHSGKYNDERNSWQWRIRKVLDLELQDEAGTENGCTDG